MSAKVNCCVKVYPRERFGSFHGHPCLRPAAVDVDGKYYCKQHSPDAEKKREEASRKAYDERIEDLNRKRRNETVGEWLRVNDSVRYQGILKGTISK